MQYSKKTTFQSILNCFTSLNPSLHWCSSFLPSVILPLSSSHHQFVTNCLSSNACNIVWKTLERLLRSYYSKIPQKIFASGAIHPGFYINHPYSTKNLIGYTRHVHDNIPVLAEMCQVDFWTLQSSGWVQIVAHIQLRCQYSSIS